MKDFVALFTVVVLAVIGVGWYVLPGSPHNMPIGPKGMIEQAIAKPPAPSKKMSANAREHRAHPFTSVKPAQDQPFTAPPATATAPVATEQAGDVATPDPVRYPSPVVVPPGEDRQQLFDGYGLPTLAASTQDRGHLFETYVYRGDRSQTHIHLEDGRVAWVTLNDLPRLTTSAQGLPPLRAVPHKEPVNITAANTPASTAYPIPGVPRVGPTDQTNAGLVTVTSEPAGAVVEINQVPAGSTPVTLKVSPVGLGFTLSVTKDGFTKWMVQTVATAKPSSLHAKLAPAFK